MVSLCSCEAYMTTLRFLALLLVILVESLAAVHITTWIMVLCALTRLSEVIREGNTHMYQSSCFMGQWFLFIRKLLQIFQKLCPVLFCFAIRYSAIQKQFGFQVGSLEIQLLNYKTQQSSLFPLLNYAYRFVGLWLNWLYMAVLNTARGSCLYS